MKMLLNRWRLMEVIIDDRDQCSNCQNKKLCPLIRTLKDDVVILRFGRIDVKWCGLFKQKEA